ncbi:TPA: DUF5677 domain-containing protein [Legionella feeleii]
MSYKRICNYLDSISEEINKDLHSLKYYYSKRNTNVYDQKLWATANYLSLIKYFDEIIFLLKGNHTTTLPLIVRSQIDVFVNIYNIKNNYHLYLSYAHRIFQDKDAKVVGRLFTDYQKKTLSAKEETQFLEYLKYFEEKFDILKTHEPQFLTESKKRKKAQLIEDLEDAYKFCSSFVHCGHDALERRHYIKIDNNYFLSSTKPLSKETVYLLLLTSLNVLQSSSTFLLLILTRFQKDYLFSIKSKIDKAKKIITSHLSKILS